ncbi:MAG: YkgJ family cysteine cluster protein [Myxococcota bacterium]|nr:YkgJ family cysteine cluster protein [Myxococcota bacterium]
MSRHYEELCRRIDAFHGTVQEQHPGALTCHQGCSSCCEVHLSLSGFEFKRIAQAILELPVEQVRAIRNRLEAGRKNPRCLLLTDEGSCRVYRSRPVICRSHGLPIQVGEPPRRDVCPLNFKELEHIDQLQPDVVLDVNHVNLVLATLDHMQGAEPGARVDLWDGVKGLLKADTA